MRNTVSAERLRAGLIARAIKGVKGDQWKTLPAQDRREAIEAARRVVRALNRIDSRKDKAAEEH